MPAVFEPPPPPPLLDVVLVEEALGLGVGVIVTTRVWPGETFVTTDGVAEALVGGSDSDSRVVDVALELELEESLPPATGTPESPLVRYTPKTPSPPPTPSQHLLQQA